MKLFTEQGFAACSVQDITEAAGAPKGSFYNHYESKEALAAEIVTAYGQGSTDRGVLAPGHRVDQTHTLEWTGRR